MRDRIALASRYSLPVKSSTLSFSFFFPSFCFAAVTGLSSYQFNNNHQEKTDYEPPLSRKGKLHWPHKRKKIMTNNDEPIEMTYLFLYERNISRRWFSRASRFLFRSNFYFGNQRWEEYHSPREEFALPRDIKLPMALQPFWLIFLRLLSRSACSVRRANDRSIEVRLESSSYSPERKPPFIPRGNRIEAKRWLPPRISARSLALSLSYPLIQHLPSFTHVIFLYRIYIFFFHSLLKFHYSHGAIRRKFFIRHLPRKNCMHMHEATRFRKNIDDECCSSEQ